MLGICGNQPAINSTEISAWRWVAPEELSREMAAHGDRFTPWLKLEWSRLRQQFGEDLGGMQHLE